MFYDNLARLCRSANRSVTAVCTELGFSRSNASYWKKSGTHPTGDGLQKFADYFNVSTDYLLNGETKKEPPEGDSLDPRQFLKRRIDEMSEEEYERFVQICKAVLPERFKDQ